jgi:general secretion pathway protein J
MVEVLLAMSILVMITTLVWSSLSNTIRSRETAEAVQARYHVVNLTMNRLAKEISHAYLSCNYDQAATEPRTRTVFIGEDEGDIDTLTFTSTGHLRLYRNSRESDQAVVSFYGENAPRGEGKRIVRRESPLIRNKDDNLDKDKGQKLVLTEGVEKLNLEYWDTEKQDWVDEWDSTAVERRDKLPDRVKITLKMTGRSRRAGGKEEEFVTQARVYNQRVFGVGPDGSVKTCVGPPPPDSGDPSRPAVCKQLDAVRAQLAAMTAAGGASIAAAANPAVLQHLRSELIRLEQACNQAQSDGRTEDDKTGDKSPPNKDEEDK